MPLKVLAGDIGGTNARLALCDVTDSGVKVLEKQAYDSGKYESLEAILSDYIANQGVKIEAISLGIPCPLKEGQCETTNLPWHINVNTLTQAAGGIPTSLLNDLEALAWGIGALQEDQLHTLIEGEGPVIGNAVVIAAGTGLGQAGLFWDGHQHHPFSTEGGHCDFAPADDMQIELLRFMQRRQEHISWERLISGPGLSTLYEFVVEHEGEAIPDWYENALNEGNSSELVSKKALDEEDDLCVETLSLFIKLLGAEAGNLAMKMKATGGVYIGGGIAPVILDWLQLTCFRDAFLHKGRMQPLMEQIPVKVILSGDAALLGAARYLQQGI